MSARALAPAVLALLALLAGCGSERPEEGEAPSFVHDRRDYAAFRARHPGALLEPNFLPFMATRVRVPAPPSGWLGRLGRRIGLLPAHADLLVLCHWPQSAFPLAVYIASPEFGELPDDELDPLPPATYVRAVAHALRLWEEGLDGRVRFERVDAPERARLRIQVRGEEAPLAEAGQVLGTTRFREACLPKGAPPVDGVLPVEFSVTELVVHARDQHGLLLPDQVERVALHELGHALGMRGHSPIPGDLMFRIARDRLPHSELGIQDVNSFLGLYALPSGTIYARIDPAGPREAEPPQPPRGTPRLDLAPHVDARLGFEVQLPEGWPRVPMDQGVVAVDGTSWDYDASLQILVRAYDSVEEYLARYARAHFRGAQGVRQGELELAGLEGLRFEIAENRHGFAEQLSFLDAGDGRVFVVIAECPAGLEGAWHPWFEQSLATLEVRGVGEEADRDYRVPAGP